MQLPPRILNAVEDQGNFFLGSGFWFINGLDLDPVCRSGSDPNLNNQIRVKLSSKIFWHGSGSGLLYIIVIYNIKK